MTRLKPSTALETDDEYRAIEQALLESARGRWFLAEHGRRARRLDSALLEDAIGRLQTSLRQPPALLDQLETELGELKTHLNAMREELLARPHGVPSANTAVDGTAPRIILKAAEDLHEIAWSLQANPFDPKGCEEIARNAARLYTLSQDQATHAERTLGITSAIEGAMTRVDAVLETIAHERTVDAAASAAAG
jgi:hypothetical protein